MSLHLASFIQYDTSFAEQAGMATGTFLGFYSMLVLLSGFVVILFFLVRFFIKKSSSNSNTINTIQEKREVLTHNSICNNCTTKNASEVRFCNRCGFEISKV